MNNVSRKSLIGTFALAAVLSAPLAFAQSTDPAAAQPQQTSPPTQDTTAADPSAPNKKSWADVDTDGDGKLSKTEASTVPALGQVFEEADTDADGALTADEYKAYVAQVQNGGAASDDGQR